VRDGNRVRPALGAQYRTSPVCYGQHCPAMIGRRYYCAKEPRWTTERIDIDPAVMMGKSVIRGTRINGGAYPAQAWGGCDRGPPGDGDHPDCAVAPQEVKFLCLTLSCLACRRLLSILLDTHVRMCCTRKGWAWASPLAFKGAAFFDNPSVFRQSFRVG